jgi:hypothetical protein
MDSTEASTDSPKYKNNQTKEGCDANFSLIVPLAMTLCGTLDLKYPSTGSSPRCETNSTYANHCFHIVREFADRLRRRH